MKVATKRLISTIADAELPPSLTRVDRVSGTLLLTFPDHESLAGFIEWAAADADAPFYSAVFGDLGAGEGWQIVATARDLSSGDDTMLHTEYVVLIPAEHHAPLLKWLSDDSVAHHNLKVSRLHEAYAKRPPPVPEQMDEEELLHQEIGLERILEDLLARGLAKHKTTVQLEKVRLALLALYAELGVREPTPCDDCGMDVYAAHEGFTLRDEVWQSAGGNRWDKKLGRNAHGAAHLCVGCVEHRLGRRLTRADFIPCSAVPQIHDSQRLLDRKGNPSPPPESAQRARGK